jgi:putative FmdB family regulatory protein
LLGAMPIYEYRCPNGHLFEVFHRMDDPPPEACEVCGAAPVTKVLHPVPVFFKGSGFYSTDYGRRKRKKDGTEDGASKPDETAKKKDDKPEPKAKATEA